VKAIERLANQDKVDFILLHGARVSSPRLANPEPLGYPHLARHLCTDKAPEWRSAGRRHVLARHSAQISERSLNYSAS